MKKLVGFLVGLLATHLTLAAVQSPIDCHIFFDGTNTIQIVWNAYPDKSYVVQSTTNLLGTWSSTPTLVATSNSIAYGFFTTAQAQFFKVVKLDTEGPEIAELTPSDGTIAVDRQSPVSARITDLNGINTNSLSFKLGTNGPVTLSDVRLSFADGLLTYTPGTNEFLAQPGAFVTNTLITADTLGNASTNTWSFQLSLQTLLSTNIVFIGGGGTPSPRGPQPGPGDGLALISTNGDSFLFSYTGASSGLSNGMHLVKSDLQTGFTRTVVTFTEYPASNTVVTLTRPTKLAELLQQGSLQGVTFTELTSPSPIQMGPQPGPRLEAGLAFSHSYNLERVLYQDANLVIGLLPSSEMDLNAAFDIGANFDWFKLTSFEAVFSGSADFTLEAYAYASGAYDRSGEKGLITPIHKLYGAFIGPVPVWMELVFEINAGYDLHLEGSAGYTNGFNAVKQIKTGQRWDTTKGWTTTRENPELGFALLGPKWQVEAAGNLQVYLQPKVTVLVYSAAGAWADLKPYVELEGRLQFNPYEFELGLYGGLTSTLGLDLRIWDDSWGELPSVTFDLIPRTLLWEYSSLASTPPQVTVPPQPQSVSVGGTATFTAQAGGASPLSYRWQKDGLNLTEGGRITGTRGSTLRIANAQTSDTGNYRVIVTNPNGLATSQSAPLTVSSGSTPGGMALIPAGSFTMGDTFSEGLSGELPLHTVYVSAFHMDKYQVTKALWDEVKAWSGANGYSYDNAGWGKATDHPVYAINWYDMVKWCNARSQKEGLTPCYYTDAGLSTIYKTGQVAPYVKWNANGYRLPTEAEWEKAARGGARGQRFPWGNTISWSQASYWADPTGFAYDVNPTTGYHPAFSTGDLPYTSPVGYFAANGYGLYDMAGNVFEWCWDWYQSDWYSQAGATQSNAHGPTGPLSDRVVRGGDWSNNVFYYRCAYRGSHKPFVSEYGAPAFGFRCVRGF